MQDQIITCAGVDKQTPCPYREKFVHSVKDQEFYQEKGFDAPKRCHACRAAKKSKNGDLQPKESHSGAFQANAGYREGQFDDGMDDLPMFTAKRRPRS